MPRTARATPGGYCYHVLNRGNRRAEVYHTPDDYAIFVALLRRACARIPMRLLGYCLMPNHFHLVLWPLGDRDLSRWMQWLLTAHVHSYRTQHRSTGHVWQGRFKAFPIDQDQHLLSVLRYVERNPLRANLVAAAEDWPWSSLSAWCRPALVPFLDPGPVPRSADWVAYVNRPETEAELARLRYSAGRQAPFGNDSWVRCTAATLGLESSLRPAGRPRRTSLDPKQPFLFPTES
jgi:putative transposase